MAKEIRQKIVLDGDKQYNQAINEARRNLRTLRSELKAETAELGANATAQQKNEVKVRSLKAQIAEQEKVVKAYRDALEEVREKYGDNADEIARYEQRLNDARTSLANMKNQIDAVGNSYQAMQNGARQSATENAALALSFDRISQAADGMAGHLEGVFTGIVGVIRGTVGAVWSELMEIAAKADNYADLSAYLGSSAAEVEKWDRALRASHNDMTTMVNMVSRLKYGGKADKVTEWFGISDENYTNDLEYAAQVLQRMYDTKEEMQKNGTWDDAMGDIFGAKKVQEVDGLLSDWEDILRALKEFDVENGGVGLTNEELETMSELYAEVGLLQEKWNAFKESVTTKLFGGIALDVTSNFQGALDALIDFMDADSEEEREAAIERFQEEITQAFTKIGEAVAAAGEALDKAGSALQESKNGYVRLFGDILSAVSDVLEWLGDESNLETAKYVVEGLFGLWAGAKALKFIGQMKALSGYFTNIFSNRTIPTLNGGNGSGGGTGAQNVTQENVTTENVTNQTVTTQNVTNGTATNQTVTNETVTSATATNMTATQMTVPTETVTNATVANMVVQNMVGGQGGVPSGNNNGGQPAIPNDGSGGYPSLPYSGSTPALESGGSGFNGYVPITLPGGGGSGGGDLYLPNADSVNLSGGEPTLNLPGGDNTIRLDPGDYSIDEPMQEPVFEQAPEPVQNSGNNGGGLPMIGPIVGTTLGMIALGGIAYAAAQGNYQYAGIADPYRYSNVDNRETLEAAVNGILYRETMNGRWNVGYLAANAKTPEGFVSLFDYEDANGGSMNWLEAVMGGRDQMAQAAIYEIMRGAYGQDFTRNLNPELKSLLEDQGASAYMALDKIDYASLITGMRQFFSDHGTFDEDKNWIIPEEEHKIFSIMDRIREMMPDRGATPADWWEQAGNAGSGGSSSRTPDENGISSEDLSGFLGVPAGVESAAEKGVRKGISGLRVEIDGQAAGRILAPYVSEEIARDVG